MYAPVSRIPVLSLPLMFTLTALLSLTVLLIACGIHFYLFTGMDAPPSDFGSGHMFDAIATRYDRINRILAVGMDLEWRRQMIHKIQDSFVLVDTTAAAAAVRRPHLLDVATGTADVALLMAQAIPSASIVGIDPSPGMLQVARKKVKDHNFESVIQLQVADAQDLTTLSAQSFDGATMAFGIRNVPDRSKALCEIHAVLKDRARFCILEFSEPDPSFGVLGIVARYFIRHVVPVLGGLLSGAPREYWHLQHSIRDFPTPTEFVQLLQSIQCPSGTYVVEELVQMNYGSVQLYVLQKVQRHESSASSTEES